jgi:translation initiation factor IF-2
MTEDIKATRLSKAAREFNVGISTIVEFLHRKGFDLDPNPNTKLPHEAYLLLLKEYSSDLNVKKESEKLILKDLHRKKESVSIDDVPDESRSEDQDRDDEIFIKDTLLAPKSIDIKTEVKKPDIKLVGKIDLDKTLKPKTVSPEAPKAEEEKKVRKEVPSKEEAEKKKPAAEKQKEAEAVKDEKAKSPIDIHIVGKIDLETIARESKAPK